MFKDYRAYSLFVDSKLINVNLTIIDSDFTKVLSKEVHNNQYISCKAGLFIKCYEELNLNVAYNFYFYILKNIIYYGKESEQILIDACMINIPEHYNKYHKEIMQYKKRFENQKAFW